MDRDGKDSTYSFEDHGGLLDANGKPICWFGNGEAYYPTDGEEPSSSDIERIVACVNACRGIPTEALQPLHENDDALAAMLRYRGYTVSDMHE